MDTRVVCAYQGAHFMKYRPVSDRAVNRADYNMSAVMQQMSSLCTLFATGRKQEKGTNYFMKCVSLESKFANL